MKIEDAQLLMMRGVISELPEEKRAEVHAIAVTIRDAVSAAGDSGLLALALVGAETAAEEA